MTTATSAPPMMSRRRLTAGRLASALFQESPYPVRDVRHFLAEPRLLQLAGPLRRPASDHHAAAEAIRDERRPARVAPRTRDRAGARGKPDGLLEVREVPEEGVQVAQQPQPVLEDRH